MTRAVLRLVPAHPAPVRVLAGGTSPTQAPVAGSRVARTVRHALPGAVGGAAGLAPHLLHHVGLLAGTAAVAGSGGTLLFGVLGLVASVPLLRRLHRRFRTWWAPALGLAVFAAMFAVSAFLVGPEISGQSESPPTPAGEHDDTHDHDRGDPAPGPGR